MVIYCETETGNYFKLALYKEDETIIDPILDQFNLGKFKIIAEDQCYIADPVTFIILDENDENEIAEFTCKRINLEPLYSLMMELE